MSKKKDYLLKALDWISKRSTLTVKAKIDGYDAPKIFTNQSTQEEVQADISFVTQGGAKSFTEIALISDSPQKLVTRWKLLSTLASLKHGKLHLFAPRGHKMFTQNLIERYNISAVIHSV